MPSFSIRQLTITTLCAAIAIASAYAASNRHLLELASFSLQRWQNATEWQARSLWLHDYRVVTEAREIEGLTSDISALTFDPDRRTLFSVTNQNPELIELSLTGQIIRRIPLHGFGDAEAIEYIRPNHYIISDERQQRLFQVKVEDDTQHLHAADSEQLSLGIDRNGNKGIEGLAYDPAGKRLFVAKERDPMRIYEIHGFPRDEGSPLAVQVVDNPKRDRRLFVRDLSSLDFDRDTGHLLALSDESRRAIEIDTSGHPVSTLSLRSGRHGLKRDVPQAEGIALDDQGTLYLVSEPNLFYVFRKPKTRNNG